MYSRVRASGLGYGWPYQPSTTCGPDAPNPKMNRPLDRWSMVMAAMAVAAGVRAAICTMPVPSRSVVVCDPHHANGVRQSEPYASAVQMESNPSRSASAMASTALGGGAALQ